jgi:DNA invertase Pin-like site-specific DNA recombinase
MSIYAYYVVSGDAEIVMQVQGEIQKYLDQHKMKTTSVIEDHHNVKVQWQKRAIGRLFDRDLQPGDELVVYEAAEMARSTSQMIEILGAATELSVKIHFVKYNECFTGSTQYPLTDLLRLMQNIESDYIARRTTDALARRRAAGLPLGRPKGRKNKSLKLDRHKKEIMRYIEIGISKASIAKLIGCHPQTLYDWLDRNDIQVAKSKRGRGAITGAILAKLEKEGITI